MLVLQSETDVTLLGGGRPKQPDGPRVRLWEIAGAAHADTYIIIAGAQDDGRATPARLAELMQPTRDLMIGQTASLINAGPQQHYVGEAALAALDRWAAPAAAPRLELTPDGAACAVDRLGNAKGGVRSPWVDAPTAVLSGLGQSGGTFGFLYRNHAALRRRATRGALSRRQGRLPGQVRRGAGGYDRGRFHPGRGPRGDPRPRRGELPARVIAARRRGPPAPAQWRGTIRATHFQPGRPVGRLIQRGRNGGWQ